MAPYAIAHLKLSLFLEETGYQFDSGKRLGVYLTNTLDDAVRKSEFLFGEFIAEEADQAAEIKRDKSIMVVVGNPPYSVSSSNNSEFIEGLMTRYKKAVRSEKNIQPLSDDYIKFLCFSQYQIEKTGEGLIGFITNHSYLNGLIHRGMRQELLQSFEELYIIDLHGNSLLQETSPNGNIDQNIFDIQQGVATLLAIKGSLDNRNIQALDKKQSAQVERSNVSHYDLWGDRNYKYKFLSEFKVDTVNWSMFCPPQPSFFFSPKNYELEPEYNRGWLTTEVFQKFSTGIETGKDSCLVDFHVQSLKEVIKHLYDSSVSLSQLKDKYKIEETSG
jgi:predicted helicase